MNIEQILSKAHEGMASGTVFGDPIEQDGVVVIPAARVMGGGGGGTGTNEDAEGEGGGYGLVARPVGAYRIKDGEVDWIPAADTTRVIIGGQIVGIVALLVFRSILRRRRKR
jgi:uncharacterized spore protein YtfJ